jgi:hypothetical protein
MPESVKTVNIATIGHRPARREIVCQPPRLQDPSAMSKGVKVASAEVREQEGEGAQGQAPDVAGDAHGPAQGRFVADITLIARDGSRSPASAPTAPCGPQIY